jgi:hypothetical protein
VAIRIDGPGRTGGIQGPGTTRRAEGTGATFRLPEQETASRPGVVGGPVGMTDVASLLALQSVPAQDPREKKRKAVRRGLDILDVLEGVRLDLLGGGVSPDRLERLVGLMGGREPTGDERLDGLVADIELRARVELAKLGRFPD